MEAGSSEPFTKQRGPGDNAGHLLPPLICHDSALSAPAPSGPKRSSPWLQPANKDRRSGCSAKKRALCSPSTPALGCGQVPWDCFLMVCFVGLILLS